MTAIAWSFAIIYLPARHEPQGKTRNIDAWPNTGRYWALRLFRHNRLDRLFDLSIDRRENDRGSRRNGVTARDSLPLVKSFFSRTHTYTHIHLLCATLSWNLFQHACDICFTRINRSESFYPPTATSRNAIETCYVTCVSRGLIRRRIDNKERQYWPKLKTTTLFFEN